MIKKEYLNFLQTNADRIAVSSGIGVRVVVENVFYEFARIRFSKEYANAHPASIDAFGAEIEKLAGVDYVTDAMKGRKARGNEDRILEIAAAEGNWEETEEDERLVEQQVAELTPGTPEYDEAMRIDGENRKLYYLDYIIPIPPPPKNYSEELYLPMAYGPYDEIKDGYIDEDGSFRKKTTEFRKYTENWVKRILSHPIKTVRFQRGYGGPGRAKPDQMVWTVKGISLYNSIERTECPVNDIPVGFIPDMIAIDLGERVK